MAQRSSHFPIKEVEEKLQYRFADRILLEEALTHRSYAHEIQRPGFDNERLEFLGDAVIGVIVGRELMDRFPAWGEGLLSRWRSYFVSRQVLADLALGLQLGECMMLGRGEKLTGGAQKPSVLAGVFEAVVGAMFMDSSLETCHQFIIRLLAPELEEITEDQDKIRRVLDTKTYLQECVQSEFRTAPVYRLVDEWGLDHEKSFRVELVVQGRRLSVGEGKSKKEAENQAALAALEELGL